ncbi:hypothetical protein Q5424_13200 [Conexibacter sp. JD483]|uniref:hypothetical protein n=1 Tax=unclassified Conexibacter TaxID=2627773 RepID=UPI00271C7196|nr:MULTISPECIES: hypothetical protein [unclassified Conexibacter]MDO8188082.1 hypothetical protein [Conexibacter sp. CPCC 205706]MDO8196922.1 hypothetical protein [Conexibacter sp. CPCC 205762]MDR9370051.1 hypothetical protein [Conexibacter sp. JD483]
MSRRRGRRPSKWPDPHERRFEPARKGPDFEQWWEETGFRELRQLLLWRWDPIGVADIAFPWAENEYDQYARAIAEELYDRTRAAELTAHLESLELHAVNPREGDDGRARLREVAELLVAWYDESRAHHREFGPRDPRPPDLR